MAYTVYELATLANAVYEITQTVVGDWKQTDTYGDPRAGGFFGALYRRGTLAVLAYRGTDDKWDISPDAMIALGQVPGQMPQAERAFSRATRVRGAAPMVMTGHSLGGALACLVAARMGLPCVTFNAPGVARSYAASFRAPILGSLLPFASPPEMAVGVVKLASLDSSKIINVRANYDVVSVGTGPRIGRVDNIAVSGCQAIELDQSRMAATTRGFTPGMDDASSGLAGEFMYKGAKYVLCQHGMGLMEQQIRNMPEYHRDLGW